MIEDIKLMVHVLVLWLVTFLGYAALFLILPVMLLNAILCKTIGRDYHVDFKLKATLIEGEKHD